MNPFSAKTVLIALALWSALAACYALASGQQTNTNPQDSSSAKAYAQAIHAKEEVKKATMQVEEIRKVIDEQRREIGSISGLIAVSPEAVRQLAERLQDQKEAMDVEDAGAEGRQLAITMAIDKTTVQLKKRETADEVTVELSKVVDAREKQFQRLKQMRESAAVSQDQVDTAEAALATARAEALASRQRAAGSSSETLDSWNRELMNITIARKERAAKLEFIQKRLKELSPALAECRELEVRLQDLARAERWLDAAVEQLRAITSSNAR